VAHARKTKSDSHDGAASSTSASTPPEATKSGRKRDLDEELKEFELLALKERLGPGDPDKVLLNQLKKKGNPAA